MTGLLGCWAASHVLGVRPLAQIFKCECRVRVNNVGSTRPSPWSNALQVQSDKEEQEEAKRPTSSRPSSRSKGPRAAEREKLADGGMAVLVDHGLEVQLDLRREIKGRAYMVGEGWSEMATTIGEFFVEAGVQDGCTGRLFDLTVAEVEDLIVNAELDPYGRLDASKPLLSFASIACWTLLTLAHHTQKPDEWITLTNAVSGLVHLTRNVPEDAVTTPMVRALLYSLIDVRETLRQ